MHDDDADLGKMAFFFKTDFGQICNVYSMSTGPRAKLPGALTALLNKPLNVSSFEWEHLHHKACLLLIEHGTSASGRKFPKIERVAPLTPGMSAPPPNHSFFSWSIGDDLNDLDAQDLPYLWGRTVRDVVGDAVDFSKHYPEALDTDRGAPQKHPSAYAPRDDPF
jgi:hypothetical protein